MSCNCKADKINSENVSLNKVNIPFPSFTTYILKILAFILMIIALPIINLFIIWFIFRTLVLNMEVDIKPLLYAIGSKFKPNEDDEDDDYNNLNEDEVEMIDVEDITNKSK